MPHTPEQQAMYNVCHILNIEATEITHVQAMMLMASLALIVSIDLNASLDQVLIDVKKVAKGILHDDRLVN